MKLISNLSQTLLCPFQLLTDIAFQLQYGEHSAELETMNGLMFEPVCPLDSPTDWVNLDDSVGDLSAMRAFELCQTLIAEIRKQSISRLDLHLHLAEQSLTRDNIMSLIYLSESGISLSIHLYTHTPKKISLEKALSLLNDKNTIEIHYHTEERFAAGNAENKSFVDVDNHRKHLLEMHNFSIQTDNPGILFDYAWRCLKVGAPELSCRILTELADNPEVSKAMREEAFLQLQAIRFLSHQHKLVADASFPEKFDTISEQRVAYLYFIKAFSSTMTRNLSEAESCYNKAGIQVDMPLTDEDSIYKMNLYALFLVLKGQNTIAFELEERLLAYISQHYPDAVAVNHVIRMNIARLYKKDKQYEPAERAYQQAYQQLSGGGMTLFDCMNEAMDRAILFEADGQITQAIQCWLKVSLYWFSCPNPYALAVRPRLILAQERVIDTIHPLSLEKVHQFLLNKFKTLLSSLANTQAGNKLLSAEIIRCLDETASLAEMQPYDFIADNRPSTGHKRCYVMDELVVYGYEKTSETQKQVWSASENRLRILISQLLKQYLPVRTPTQSFAIETLFDLPTATTVDAARLQATLADCQDVYFQDHCLEIQEPMAKTSLNEVRLALSDMLLAIEHCEQGLHLHYKRSFLNQIIDNPAFIEMIERIKNAGPVSVSELGGSQSNLWQQLIAKKVLSLVSPFHPKPNARRAEGRLEKRVTETSE